MTKELEDILRENAYFSVREIPHQGVCGLRRMMYTVGLFCNLDEYGCGRRYCYGHQEDAEAAIAAWSGEGDPPGPWIKEKPSDRKGPGSHDRS